MKERTNRKKILLGILLLIGSMSIIGQVNTVYIDPQYTGTKNGTITQPYNSWADLTWKAGYTYLFKCGSTYTTSTSLRPGASSITIGSYGTGARPIISSSIDNGSKVFDLGSLKDVTIRDLEVISTNNAQTCFHFFNSVRGSVINCKIHGSEWGIRNVSSTGLFRIINCEIYLTGDDGSYNESYDSIEVSGTYIHDVNQKYFVNTDQTYSGGDCLQLHDVGHFYVHDNILDHSGTGNKFCFISENDNTLITTGTLERNVLKRSNEGNLVYIYESVHNAVVRYNKFENAGIGIYNHSNSAQIYYNEFINISDRVIEGLSLSSSNTVFVDNTIYNVSKVIAECYNDNMTIQNNIIYNCYGQAFEGHANLKLDYNCYYQMNTPGISSLGTKSINADPQFNNIANLDFSLKSSSPCIDKGSNIMGSCIDLVGCTVPKGNATDMGALEYGSTSTPPLNKVPVVNITSPVNGSNYNAPASITLAASASDSDGTVSKVEFYNGSTKLGESLIAPYSFTWSNVSTGTYKVTAIATDNSNAKTTSTAISIVVNTIVNNNPPILNITSPANNATYIAPSSITITANASDADGSINKVEFYNGSIKLGESTGSPYSYVLNNPVVGTYLLTAIATDNSGSKTTSSVISVIINANKLPMVNITSPSVNSTFTDPASIAINANASDADGSISKVEFFNGSIKLGESSNPPYTFTWNNVIAGTYNLTAVATDNLNSKATSTAVQIIVASKVTLTGAIFYRNSGFSGTAVTLVPGNYTIAQLAALGLYDKTISSIVTNGYQVVAYSNDNFSGTSITVNANQPDLANVNFNDQISSIKVINLGTTTNLPPVVSLTSPSNGKNYTIPANIIITAKASDADGTISKVEFYNGSTKLGESTASPYSFTWQNVTYGTYKITAVATDNLNAKTTSSISTVYVNGSKAAQSPDSVTGVTNIESNAVSVNVFPNPNNGLFSVKLDNLQKDTEAKIIITDMAGRNVYNSGNIYVEGTKDFDISSYKSGMYLITVIFGDGYKLKRKIIKK